MITFTLDPWAEWSPMSINPSPRVHQSRRLCVGVPRGWARPSRPPFLFRKGNLLRRGDVGDTKELRTQLPANDFEMNYSIRVGRPNENLVGRRFRCRSI
ncbi:hypothetical protein CEXT_800061 [Caerostris extrusa]|uniref:Uncharacterized protein n=1 Tax=Caerostris extrusa TaxID=172846 RepID=A0AAV4UU73_CAEEX|nr:hypothetical protein CEXT_800061 [Caerostris extrusa]